MEVHADPRNANFQGFGRGSCVHIVALLLADKYVAGIQLAVDRSSLMQVLHTEAELGKPVKDLRLRELLFLELSLSDLVFERAARNVLHDSGEPLCLRLENI